MGREAGALWEASQGGGRGAFREGGGADWEVSAGGVRKVPWEGSGGWKEVDWGSISMESMAGEGKRRDSRWHSLRFEVSFKGFEFCKEDIVSYLSKWVLFQLVNNDVAYVEI